MNTSTRKNGNSRSNGALRRWHRWLGLTVALFTLPLSCTGIALNHADAMKLDDRYVSTSWLLSLYGIRAPADVKSFAHQGRRATLLGQRLYLDDQEVADGIESLTGMIVIDRQTLVTTASSAMLYSDSNELIEKMEVSMLPGPIDRVAVDNQRAVIGNGVDLVISDAGINNFEVAAGQLSSNIDWTTPSPPPAPLLQALQTKYVGRGLSVSRLMADIHSGRIFKVTGTVILDALAVLLIVLGVSGFVMWLRSFGSGNARSSRTKTGNS